MTSSTPPQLPIPSHFNANKVGEVWRVPYQHRETENYSVFKPEVLDTFGGRSIAAKNNQLIQQMLDFDRVMIAGQAKSHCVSWTVEDILAETQQRDDNLAQKIYLLEDCTSPVVVPGIVDYTEQAETAFKRFAEAGMNRVKSTETSSW